ncbi:cation transporter [Bacillaceae bacterium SIJ1]|uniref:cation diffusion facilitator family transporter n=1 Tax=Litoribacterium kuwaitense TaxID=1398745 RepID=UPI0013EAB5C3|nr:cation diffusion facilitator family transporter [Litoribacterium kuwaitense]NGP46047.1 cation transporter [Litoribacterium kuwaitense]
MNGNGINSKKADVGVWISLGAYIVLTIGKMIFSFIFNSQALLADGLNNATDIIASIAVLIGLHISRRPPDEDHKYGHSRAETIASLVASFIMVTIGLQVLVDAGMSLFSGNVASPDAEALWVALIGIAVMGSVALYNHRLAKQTGSLALKAVAKDNLSDALVSAGAAVGILGAALYISWLDPVAAAVVGLVILKTAWEIFYEATHMLTDGFQESRLEEYHETISRVAGVRKTTDIKGRMYGNQAVVDVTIEVDPDISVEQSHRITDKIEEKMHDVYGVEMTHIHIEPNQAESERLDEEEANRYSRKKRR